MMAVITVLSGGTGTPKLLQGLVRVIDQKRLTVVVNTAEDTEISGLYVSPDVDTVVYTLAGIVNENTWYGIAGDTFNCHEMLGKLGASELLRIGDRDRAVKLYRTLEMKRGLKLSEVTAKICRALGVGARVLPMSDDRVRTIIQTCEGEMSFHEFWVARRAEVGEVKGVTFENLEGARPAPGVIESIEDSRLVVIGPSNPITSIGPILGIKEIRGALERNREKVVAVSPIVGGAPVSGPAGILMKATGREVSPLGVAEIYRDVLGTLLIDRRDSKIAPEIEKMGIRVRISDLMMPDIATRERLAREILNFLSLR